MSLVQMNLNVILCQRRLLPVGDLEKDNAENVCKNEEKAKEVKKCLFGPSNPEETKRMLDEQFECDRKRLLDRYDVDILELEKNFEKMKENGKVKVNKKRRSLDNVLKPYNKQARLTDIFQVRKRCQSILKSKEEKTEV
ncbi:uncharacterized protein [Onthophagus taurus]|uniref:uncharacterized protein n=1 Tax=Onthophagus taurus TaxID=166361 RepID=UPI000C20D7D6|nr:uncharacterized protein LOC111415706 [Onthophagus taurus]